MMQDVAKVPAAPGSTTAANALGLLRKQLIDTSKRSRLVNARLGNVRSRKQLDIQDELSDEVFRRLYRHRKFMRFKSSEHPLDATAAEDSGRFYVPSRNALDPAERHTDHWLQTSLSETALHKRLLTLYRDASSFEEEQGVSVLYLALGFVKWFESESSDRERFAPLLLLPADLKRDSARSMFKLELRDQELEPNWSFASMLRAEFDLVLPDLPGGEEWLPSEYFQHVERGLSSQPRWRLLPDAIQLGFYSFAKFLMYKDLEDAGTLDDESLLSKLLVHGFESNASVLGGSDNLDARFQNPRDLGHILDADASQARVIDAARKGHSLVVQGPPGTGKSQTIANIIAAAVASGKTVLFVAEKRAALDVVHARLEKCDLGPVCLELHSHKVSKKHVYADLKRTLDLGSPAAVLEEQYLEVARIRDQLNETSNLLHAVDDRTGQTAFNIMGVLSKLRVGGLPRPDYAIEGIAQWTADDFARRREAASYLAALTQRFGPEQHHGWRGTEKRLGPIDQDRLRDALADALAALEALEKGYRAAVQVLGLQGDARLAQVGAAQEQLEALNAMPAEVPVLLRREAAVEEPNEVFALLERVAAFQAQAAELQAEVISSAFRLPWEQTRMDLAAASNWFKRLVSGRYRRAKATVHGICKGARPKKRSELLTLVDRLIAHLEVREGIQRQGALGRAALGHAWKDEHTEVTVVLPAAAWLADHALRVGSGSAVRAQLGALPKHADLAQMAATMERRYTAWNERWLFIEQAVGMDVSEAFGTEDIDAVLFDEVERRLRAWHGHVGGINDWFQFRTAARRVAESGLEPLRMALSAGRLDPAHVEDTVTFLWAEATWKRLCAEHPMLNEMDGEERSRKVAQFKRLDRRLQDLAAQEVMLAHYRQIPAGASGQIGLVRGEAAKKSRHMPIRKLLDKAVEAVQLIKPVFLMSPLSVAQYLSRDRVRFDLLLIDEASQVRPADAIGAMGRASQVIVVGDQKQLPPTAFFDKQISAEAEDEDDLDVATLAASQVGDMESILSLCEARGMTGSMLEWHYRSSHPSLIAVSNHTFYDDRLICPPSPVAAGEQAGMLFTYLEGEYLRGTKRTNPKEADAVVEAVLEHAGTRPSETLGVVALSVAQRDEIRNKIEFQRTRHPELEAFCNEDNEDPFFVKNLENVQGDERDVIFVSIGYGRDAGGYMSQSYGPISSDGGERRLNVLFTRSRKCCRIFSSIRHSDIRLDAVRHLGPRVLARFLKYAETGEMDIPAPTGGGTDSPFEESVLKVLQRYGYQVALQVGTAGFRIDLAVCDPEDAGRYILAIECDGARYHSSSWARERDRLRQTVLESKGWTFHRIWSTDWFQDQEGETKKLVSAVELARTRGGAPPAAPALPRTKVQRSGRNRKTVDERVEYTVARDTLNNSGAISIPEATVASLAELVRIVVDIEGPVHRSIVKRRCSRIWGNARMGARISERLDRAISRAVEWKLVRLDSTQEFLDRYRRSAPIVPRDRSKIESSLERRADMLPPDEIRSAAVAAVTHSFTATPEECTKEVIRLLGYSRLTKSLRERIARVLRQMVQEGIFIIDGEYLRLAQA